MSEKIIGKISQIIGPVVDVAFDIFEKQADFIVKYVKSL
jgi:rRNA processing protein Gar1